jgi:hypothetical protein
MILLCRVFCLLGWYAVYHLSHCFLLLLVFFLVKMGATRLSEFRNGWYLKFWIEILVKISRTSQKDCCTVYLRIVQLMLCRGQTNKPYDDACSSFCVEAVEQDVPIIMHAGSQEAQGRMSQRQRSSDLQNGGLVWFDLVWLG